MLRRTGPRPPRLTESACHVLLESDYRRNNVSELREVVELARRVADGQDIRAEHILGGAAEKALPPGVDLATGPEVPWWCRPPLLRALRFAVATVFASVIILCLVASDTSVGKLANASIWASWEPVVFALFLIAGPLWCTVCPLSTAGRLTGRVGSLDRPPPKWMFRFGPWLTVLGIRTHRVVGTRLPDDPKSSALGRHAGRVGRCRGHPRLGLPPRGLVPSPVPFGSIGGCPGTRLTTPAHRPSELLRVVVPDHACYTGNSSIPGCTVFHHRSSPRRHTTASSASIACTRVHTVRRGCNFDRRWRRFGGLTPARRMSRSSATQCRSWPWGCSSHVGFLNSSNR